MFSDCDFLEWSSLSPLGCCESWQQFKSIESKKVIYSISAKNKEIKLRHYKFTTLPHTSVSLTPVGEDD